MKKDKNSLKQKIVIAIACLVIVACTISMTTMAWFTDTMQGTTNLTFGKIKLSDEYTKYTFNTPEAPAVASREINDKNWTIVLDETSNDAFIRLIAKYGAPIDYDLTTDTTYLPNKAYYDSSRNKLEAVESDAGEGQYVVGDSITTPNSTVYECKYSLDYITSANKDEDIGNSAFNPTFAKIIDERFTTQYYPVVSEGVLGTTFLKGVKYYAFIGGEFRALIGSTTYDANTDYFYGQAYTEFDPDGNNSTIDTVYVAYNYSTSADTKTYKIVDVTDPDTGALLYKQLIETTTNPEIGIDVNSIVGTAGNDISANRYTIYNAYIDWLIENVAIPKTPEAVGHYFTEVDTDSEDPVGVELTQGDYAFIKSAGTNQGTAEYYLASDLDGTALNAERTDEDGITYNFTFAKKGDIKIKDSADQLTLKSATLTAITSAEALTTAKEGQDADKILKLVDGFYTVYNGTDAYAENTYYIYNGNVTVINKHVYFLTTGVNGTPVELKYAQKDLGLGLSVDIQAIQTILSRKATSSDADLFGTATVETGDKLTIAIIVAADTVATGSSLVPANEAGKLGAYLNGKVVRVATIADIAPFFVAQFGAAN